jgi:pimeloyl-ACP methyl ester carboxylesterase
MPTVRVNGIELYYEDTGGGAETIVFSHGLLWNTQLFDYQVAALKGRYRCIAYDHRGQGRSEVPHVSAIPVETLYDDGVALLEKLGITKCHFAGLSLGSFVAQRLALRRPDLLHSIILMASSAEPEVRSKLLAYWFFGQVARFGGLWFAAQYAMPILFGPTFRRDPARVAERQEWFRRLLANKPDIYRAVNGNCIRGGIADQIAKIDVPTLILVGEEDIATKPVKAERLHAAIHGSILKRIPHAGHTLTVEQPEAVNRAIIEFLEQNFQL